ncbi:MAG TPA: type II toxin-antitoxin system death-on-curing family toxin [Candidatus Saccharimonadales bacterium]|nr:type II toxin-antitoxin system death-on-curing family toxin [Candidatus Saccharimonadales bacterium]
MENIIYLTLEQILIIHEDQVDRYGGTPGLRDLPLLESAVLRPQTTFSGKDLYETHFEKAAALMHSIMMNHAFIDGNKRTGVVAALVYLELNNIKISIEENQLVEAVLLIEKEKWKIKEIAKWFENNSIKN